MSVSFLAPTSGSSLISRSQIGDAGEMVMNTGSATPERAADRSGELAQVLADGDPHVWRTLRARHVAGPDGRCRAYPSAVRLAARWPCTLRAIADQAPLRSSPVSTEASDRVRAVAVCAVPSTDRTPRRGTYAAIVPAPREASVRPTRLPLV